MSERLTPELGRPSSEVKRSDKRPSGPGFESLRLDFWAIPGRPPALSRRVDCTWTFFAGFYTTAASGSALRLLGLLPKSPSITLFLLMGFSCVRFSELIFRDLDRYTAVL